MAEYQIIAADSTQTFSVGQTIGQAAWPGLLVLLDGQLGSGKTVIAQGIGAGLAVRQPITSPTYPIIQEYAGRLPFIHIDLYRVDSQAELVELGLEDYLNQTAVVAVEWSARAKDFLTAEVLSVTLTVQSDGSRLIGLQADAALLKRLGHDPKLKAVQ